MNRTDTQLGGGYTYQWECAILLALNYFYEPVSYESTLYDLVTGFLGEVTEVHLEGKKQVQKVDPEGKEQKQVVDLEDIALVSGQRQILIQVKTKQADWGNWTLKAPLLLKALHHFYDSPLLTQESDASRFVFLTNRPFNRDLVKVQRAIQAGTLSDCPEARRLLGYLQPKEEEEKETLDPERFFLMLERTALVPYLPLDAVEANIQAKLQAYGWRDWEDAYALLFAHFARQSTRLGGAIVSRESIAEVLGPQTPRDAIVAPEDLFTVPFIRNPDFVGRQEDLEGLHRALHEETPVGIRPAGLTGMGGIGKTQLAVEYAYRYRDGYPGGVFWINAAEPLTHGFAQLGERLGPNVTGRSREERIRAAVGYLRQHPRALLILDNVAEPADLNRPVTQDLVPAGLPCRVLFTTRQRDLGNMTPVEVSVLPEDAALHLLLRHPARRPARDPAHAEHDQARAICRLLGWLPLALEVAGAFLGEWDEVRLADFRARLREEGALATLDEEAEDLPQASLPLIHAAAVAFTLETQWDALSDKNARLLLRVAGQLPEAAQIPVARLGLLSGIPDDGRPGRPSRLARSLKRLDRLSLVEELRETLIRLHPLVREFAAGRTPEDKTPGFRARCAANLADAFDQFALLQDHCARRGIDALQGDLLTALDLLPTGLDDLVEDTRARLLGILRLLQREAHNLRGWNPEQLPTFFAQQIHNRAAALGSAGMATQAAVWLDQQRRAYVLQQWRASSESPELERTLVGHERNVRAVAVTPDGRRAVSASDDWTLKVWDLASGEEVATLRGHKGDVNAVAVTPDGRRAVSASWDRTLKVWNLVTGEALAVLRGHDDCVRAVAVTPDGRRAVSASDDRTVRAWDLATGEELGLLRGHRDTVRAVAVTPDGQRAVSASHDRTLRVWDISGSLDTGLGAGGGLGLLRGHEGWVHAVAVTPDGRRAVSASDDRTVRVWDLTTGEELAVLRGHESSVLAVAVTPDGRRAVSASADRRTLRVWDISGSLDTGLGAGGRLGLLWGHEGWVRAVAVTPDGRRAVSASTDRTVREWDLATGEELAVLRGHEDCVRAVAVTPDGRRAVSASDDRTVRVWDISDSLDTGLGVGGELGLLRGHESLVNAVAVTPDGRRAVSASVDRTVRVWDLATGEELATLRGHKGDVNAVAVTPDGRRAVSASTDRTVRVWDLATGKELGLLRGHEGWVRTVAVTPDGRRVVSASTDRTLRVWDPACADRTGQALAALWGHEDRVLDVALTPDGRRAVSASDDRTVRVWDLATGEEQAVLRGHEGWVRAVAVTPDGRRAVSASHDRTLRVWDLGSGEELATVVLDGALDIVSVAQDGVTIVTGDGAGNVYCLRYVEPPGAE